jgi:pimeloyl-ACP methyl ester carboxylesterase
MARDAAQYLKAEARLWDHVGLTPTDRRVTLASGGQVRVQEVGDGIPFVLIHGGAISGASWCQLVAAIDGIRCIIVDRPGCGMSDPIVGGPIRDLHGLQAYADRLLPDVLDALELDQAAVGCTSYGGFFGFRNTAAAPDRVTKLVQYSWLIGAPSEGAPLTVRIGALPGMQELMIKMPMPRPMIKTALKQFGLGNAIDSGAFDDVMLDWVCNLFKQTETMKNETLSTPKLFTPIKGQNHAVHLTDDLLAKLTMPVLFLWGEVDPNGGAVIARQFAPRLPNAELVIVPDAQHAPWIDDIETCATKTQDFLLS